MYNSSQNIVFKSDFISAITNYLQDGQKKIAWIDILVWGLASLVLLPVVMDFMFHMTVVMSKIFISIKVSSIFVQLQIMMR